VSDSERPLCPHPVKTNLALSTSNILTLLKEKLLVLLPISRAILATTFGSQSRLSKYVAQRPHICNSCITFNAKCDLAHVSFTSCTKMEPRCGFEDLEVPQEANSHSLFGGRTEERLEQTQQQILNMKWVKLPSRADNHRPTDISRPRQDIRSHTIHLKEEKSQYQHIVKLPKRTMNTCLHFHMPKERERPRKPRKL
jgi:hypothetical protein